MMTFSNAQCARILNKHRPRLLRKSAKGVLSSCANRGGLTVWALNPSVIVRANGHATGVSLGCLLRLSLSDRLMVILSLCESELVA